MAPIGHARRLAHVFLAILAATGLAAASASAEPGSITAKRAEAQRVLGEIQRIDSEVSHAAEAYNLASLKLSRIERNQRDNARSLAVAKVNLERAQRTLQARLVTMYTSGASNGSAIEVLLGATSLDDLVNRVDAVKRVSSQDRHVLNQVRSFRGLVERRRVQLAQARSEQAGIVSARAAAKRQIEGRLAERQRLLSSIKGEIARMQQAERARQARLAAAARARVAAQAAAERSATVEPEASSVGAAAATASASVAPPGRYGGVVGIAMQYLGVPYLWGGASPSGFDCSGLVMYVFAKVGVSLPHSTYALWEMGTPVSRDQLQPGDLVFFNGLGHMGIYMGGNQMVHAPHTGDVVKISSLSGWYSSTYMGARRI